MKNYLEKTPKAYQEQLSHPKGVKGKKILANMFERNADIIDKIIKFIPSYTHISICDIGCGPAYSIIALDKLCHNCEIIGVDASSLSIRIAKENFAHYSLDRKSKNNVSFLTSATPTLSVRNNHFDIITVINLVHFWKDLDSHLQNIAIKLKANGTLIIYFTNKEDLLNIMDMSADIFHPYDLVDIEKSLSKYRLDLKEELILLRDHNQTGHIAIFRKNK